MSEVPLQAETHVSPFGALDMWGFGFGVWGLVFGAGVGVYPPVFGLTNLASTSARRFKKLGSESIVFKRKHGSAYPSTATVSFASEALALHAATVLRNKIARHAEVEGKF